MVNKFYMIVFLVSFNLLGRCVSQCGTFYPRTTSQCHHYSENENFCCHLTRFESKTEYSICHKIPVSKYGEISETGFVMLGVNNYTIINCGEITGANCRDTEPLIPEDCSDNDSPFSNCCMVEFPGKKKRCIYSGNKLKAYYTTKNGFTVKCFSEYLISHISFYTLLLLFVIL